MGSPLACVESDGISICVIQRHFKQISTSKEGTKAILVISGTMQFLLQVITGFYILLTGLDLNAVLAMCRQSSGD